MTTDVEGEAVRQRLFKVIEKLNEAGWKGTVGTLGKFIYELETLAEHGRLDELEAFYDAMAEL